MTTMHRPPTALDLMCDAQQHHEHLSRVEAEQRAQQAHAAVVADLSERIRDLGALIGFNQSQGRFDQVGKYLAQRAELERELAQMEAK